MAYTPPSTRDMVFDFSLVGAYTPPATQDTLFNFTPQEQFIQPDSIANGGFGEPTVFNEFEYIQPDSIANGGFGYPLFIQYVVPSSINNGGFGTPTLFIHINPSSIANGGFGEPVVSNYRRECNFQETDVAYSPKNFGIHFGDGYLPEDRSCDFADVTRHYRPPRNRVRFDDPPLRYHRGKDRELLFPWDDATLVAGDGVPLNRGNAKATDVEPVQSWTEATPAAAELSMGWSQFYLRDEEIIAPFNSDMMATDLQAEISWQVATPNDVEPRVPWQEGTFTQIETSDHWIQAFPRDREARYPWQETTSKSGLDIKIPWSGTPIRVEVADESKIPWQEATALKFTYVIQPVVEPPVFPPCYVPPPGDNVNLSLYQPMPVFAGDGVPLPIVCGPPLTYPVYKRAYIVENTVTVVRESDDAVVKCEAGSITGDRESWCEQFSLDGLPKAALTLIDPRVSGPIEIEIRINGYTWNMLAEGVSQSRKFPDTKYALTGRSLSAELAAPYAPLLTFTETTAKDASQIAETLLDGTGWTIVWPDEIDWLIPANTYSANGVSPIEGVVALAAVIGAVVKTDRTQRILYVQPYYPLSPWAWDAAAPDSLFAISFSDGMSYSWEPNTLCNGIYVAGQLSGFTTQVTRDGSDGTPERTQVSEQFLTTHEANGERGRQELAHTGDRQKYSIRTLLFPAPESPALASDGLLMQLVDPGETWIGQIMGVSVSFQRSDKKLTVWQNLSTERYMDD